MAAYIMAALPFAPSQLTSRTRQKFLCLAHPSSCLVVPDEFARSAGQPEASVNQRRSEEPLREYRPVHRHDCPS